MKIVSFNVNGIRARQHQLAELIEVHAPDIIALQETKVDDSQFPCADIEALGYHVRFFGQKSHYGVALMSRQEPQHVQYGFTHDDSDAQRRLISAEYAIAGGEILTVINGYFPQGESRTHPLKFPAKQKFYADLTQMLAHNFDPTALYVVVGDMNVAPADADVGIGAANAERWLRQGKSCFLPEEREWLATLMGQGLCDTYRSCHPDIAAADSKGAGHYSWFDYRSRGFERDPRRGLRIDLILASTALQAHCSAAGIDYTIRSMEKPSDHCPIWADFAL
ncbi:MAG: exodeoxyribonuclease III [Desulfuromonadaceae bacterium]|nr:exodeoxyribonuclease III [Desulfuromonadaceae bacterium]